jgi:hypothetical protein
MVDVSNGSNLNAYDLTILYDEEVLALETWSHGDYLSNLAVIMQVNQPGSLRLVCTQIATPGVSGDGTLLNLVFRAINPGISEIEFSGVKLSTSTSETVIPSLLGAVVTVSGTTAPTATATSIPTFTPTTTMTKIPTNTATSPQLMTPTRTKTPALQATTPPNRTATWLSTSAATSTPAGARATDSTQPVVPPQAGGASLKGTGTALPTGQISTPMPSEAQELSGTTATEDSLSPTNEPDKIPEDKLAGLNNILWGSFIFLAVVFIAMILLFIKRKKGAINGSD